MTMISGCKIFHLREGELLRVDRALGWRLRCDRGEVVLTQPGDRRDIVMQPGDEITLGSNQRVLIDAPKQAQLRVLEPLESAFESDFARLMRQPGAIEALIREAHLARSRCIGEWLVAPWRWLHQRWFSSRNKAVFQPIGPRKTSPL